MSRGIHKGLPSGQEKCVEAILAHVKQHGVVPTHTELMRALDLKSNTSVYDFLRGLAQRGIIICRPKHLSGRRATPAKDKNPTDGVRHASTMEAA